LADVFSAPAYDCRVLGQEQKPEFAVTRLRSGPREMEKAPQYPADNAILICVALTPSAVGQWRARYDGREVGVTRAIPFATTYIDLNCPMEMWVRGPFDYLHYYFSKQLLARIALDNGVSSAFQLQEVFFIEDLVVAQMTKSILAPVRHGEPLDRLALDHIAMVLGAHTLQQHCDTPRFASSPQHGLEAWQKLRAEEMLLASLAEHPPCVERVRPIPHVQERMDQNLLAQTLCAHRAFAVEVPIRRRERLADLEHDGKQGAHRAVSGVLPFSPDGCLRGEQTTEPTGVGHWGCILRGSSSRQQG